MNRVCIFCFYDKKGTVHGYHKYLLDEIKSVTSEIFIIINGTIGKDGLRILHNYSTKIFIRENSGFDGGAYSDFFSNYFEAECLSGWDEIILCNDTFIGPFVEMKNLFCIMDCTLADFWGLRCVDRGAYEYIESYFLVFRKKTFFDLFFYIKTNYALLVNANYQEVCACFERGLFGYMKYKGYSYSALIDDNRYDVFEAADINLIKYGLPILKKKSILLQRCSKNVVAKCLIYLSEKTKYDVNLIYELMDANTKKSIMEEIKKGGENLNVDSGKLVPMFDTSKEEIMDFISRYGKIYIYGAGIVAASIYCEYRYYFTSMEGFIVTNGKGMDEYLGEKVFSLDEIQQGCNIIVAMNKQNSNEVKEYLGRKDNYLYLWKEFN